MMRKSRTAILGGLAALALFASACSPAGSNSNAEDSTPSSGGASSAGAPAQSQAPTTFVVARTADIDNKDPHKSTAFVTLQTLGLVYESLVQTDENGKLIPALATKWSTSKDGKTVTFQLRKGVQWQNGDPFTSADVQASLERILNEKTGAVARSNLTQIKSIDTKGKHTVVLHLSSPDAAIFYALASTNAAILHKADIEAGTVGKKVNGTGPFEWKSWRQGQQVTLTANPDYWGGAPSIDTLEFRVIPSEASILAGARAGKIQIGVVSDPSVAHQAENGSGFSLVKQPSMSYHTLMLNGRHPPLDQLKVRQAIACAVDRQQVIDTAAFGDGQVTGPITSPGYQYDPTKGLPCDPPDLDTAKKLLEQSGHGDGFTLTTIVMSDNYATAVPEAQNLRSQLSKIGVTLKIKQMPTNPYVDAWLAANFDAAVAKNGGSSDPYLMYGRYFTKGGSLTKPAGLASPKLDHLLRKGNSTTNEKVRQSTYRKLQEQLLRLSPWVWMFTEDDYYLVSDSVDGFQPRRDESLISLKNTSLSG